MISATFIGEPANYPDSNHWAKNRMYRLSEPVKLRDDYYKKDYIINAFMVSIYHGSSSAHKTLVTDWNEEHRQTCVWDALPGSNKTEYCLEQALSEFLHYLNTRDDSHDYS